MLMSHEDRETPTHKQGRVLDISVSACAGVLEGAQLPARGGPLRLQSGFTAVGLEGRGFPAFFSLREGGMARKEVRDERRRVSHDGLLLSGLWSLTCHATAHLCAPTRGHSHPKRL